MAKPTATVRTPAAWAVAKDLADRLPDAIRRAAGPSVPLSWVGILVLLTGVIGAVLVAAALFQVIGFWAILLVYLAATLIGSGLFVLVWAAPDASLATYARLVRIGETTGRNLLLSLSVVSSVFVLAFLLALVISGQGGWLFALLMGYAAFGTLLAVVALSLGAAVVSVTSNARGYHGRRSALLIAAFGVCTIGAVVGAGLARSLAAQAVWPSVTLAVVGIVIGVFAQHHRELNDAVDTLNRALTELYTELTAPEVDDLKLRLAAMNVESAVSTHSRGPLSIAPLPLVDANLRTCVYYLLEIVTKLPIRMTTQAQSSFLAAQLDSRNSGLLLAELAWEIRRRLFRSAKAIRLFDGNAFGVSPYPQIADRQAAVAVVSDGVGGGEFGPVGGGAEGEHFAAHLEPEPETGHAEADRVLAMPAVDLVEEVADAAVVVRRLELGQE